MPDWVLTVVRWAVLLRHPRLTYWYWKTDRTGRLPDPANPQTANDKFFWRKVFDRNPEFIEVSDKLRVREWLKNRQINVEAPPVMWIGNDPAKIPDELLAKGVVVKANHGSGTNIFLEKAPPDRRAFNRRMRRYGRKPHGRKRLEWAYFGISRRLFVEALIPDITAEFKVYTFGRRIERIQIVYDRFNSDGISADVWLPDGKNGWRLFEGSPDITRSANRPMPAITEEVLELSGKIGDHFDHMRVDILAGTNRIWFGELTVYSLAGYIPLVGDLSNEAANTSWDLLESWFMRQPQTGWRKLYADRLRQVIMSREA